MFLWSIFLGTQVTFLTCAQFHCIYNKMRIKNKITHCPIFPQSRFPELLITAFQTSISTSISTITTISNHYRVNNFLLIKEFLELSTSISISAISTISIRMRPKKFVIWCLWMTNKNFCLFFDIETDVADFDDIDIVRCLGHVWSFDALVG